MSRLAGNFLIDSLVIFISFKLFKAMDATGYALPELYKKAILKVWGWGFLADIIDVIPLFIVFGMGIYPFKIPYEIQAAVFMEPFSNIWAFLIVFVYGIGLDFYLSFQLSSYF